MTFFKEILKVHETVSTQKITELLEFASEFSS